MYSTGRSSPLQGRESRSNPVGGASLTRIRPKREAHSHQQDQTLSLPPDLALIHGAVCTQLRQFAGLLQPTRACETSLHLPAPSAASAHYKHAGFAAGQIARNSFDPPNQLYHQNRSLSIFITACSLCSTCSAFNFILVVHDRAHTPQSEAV